jgi:hypothetical protein
MNFELVGSKIIKGRMAPLGVVVSGMITDCSWASANQPTEAAAITQLGFEPTSKQTIRCGIVVAVAASAHDLCCLVTGQQPLKPSRVEVAAYSDSRALSGDVSFFLLS